MSTVMAALEHAASLMQGSQGMEGIRLAERTFKEFRASGQPYEACRQILESSQSEVALFQACETMKAAAMREWVQIAPDIRSSLRAYLVQYTVTRPRLPVAVRGSALSAAAVMYKRSWLGGPAAATDFVSRVTALLRQPDTAARTTAVALLVAVLAEFGSSARSSRCSTASASPLRESHEGGVSGRLTGSANRLFPGQSVVGDAAMTQEEHGAAKRAFEEGALREVAGVLIELTAPFAAAPAALQPDEVARLALQLRALDTIMHWNFGSAASQGTWWSSGAGGGGHRDLPPSFAGGAAWRPTLLPESAESIFAVIRAHRMNEELLHPALQCAAGFAGIDKIFGPDALSRTQYLTRYARCLADAIDRVNAGDDAAVASTTELLGLASIAERLFHCFGLDGLHCLEASVLQSLTSRLVVLSSTVMRAVAVGGGDGDDGGADGEGTLGDALDAVLSGWGWIGSCLAAADDLRASAAWAPALTGIIQMYVEARMVKARRDACDDIELGEEVIPDHELYTEQLSHAACIARAAAAPTLVLLASVIASKSGELLSAIAAEAEPDGVWLAVCSEELHWLLLISGHLIADAARGEEDAIPREVMSVSAASAGPGADPLAALASTVLGLLEGLAAQAGSAGQGRVSSTVMADSVWWAARWARAYLLINESSHPDLLSMPLVEAYGEDSEGAAVTTRLLVTAACLLLKGWSGDPEIMGQTNALFLSLTARPAMRVSVIRSGVAATLASGIQDPGTPLGSLPPEVMASVTTFLCRISSAAPQAERNGLFAALLEPTAAALAAVVGQPNFGSDIAQRPEAVAVVNRAAYVLIGVASAAERKTAELLFGFTSTLLGTLVGLVGVYSAVPEVCDLLARLFTELVGGLGPWLPAPQRSGLLQGCAAAMRSFVKSGGADPRKGRSTDDAGAGSARVDDHVSLLLRLLRLIEVAAALPPPTSDGSDGTADVVVCGLELFVPLLSPAVMQLPAVSETFYNLVAYLCEDCCDRLYAAPQVLALVLQSVAHGIGNYGDVVTRLAIGCAAEVAECHHRAMQTGVASADAAAALGPIHDRIFRLLLLEQYPPTLREPGSRALFALLCCDPVRWSNNCIGLGATCSSQADNERLRTGFADLMSAGGLQPVLDRGNKALFVKGFEALLIAVRGFLLVR